ncbi:MAG: hypothetical protein DRH24_11995 [Deltaproteobacteria bacterium]|nr:MAG: hypothetical protein DRH24_11995 [Deltaproteobacteria bacterium]
MALIKYSSVVAQATGKLGSISLVNGRGGATIRMRPTSTPTARKKGGITSHILPRVQNAWFTLTQDQQSQWQALAVDAPQPNRLGIKRPLTGRQLFLKANIPRSRAHLPLLTAPPTYRDTGLGTLFSIIFYEGGPYTIDYEPPTPGTNGYLFVYADRSFSHRGFTSRGPRYITRHRFTTRNTIDVHTAFVTKFGEMDANEIYHLALQWFPDDGLQTIRASTDLTVV